MAIDKISKQMLNTFFSALDNNRDLVLWIRSPDYQKQIYVSPGFEKLWQYPQELLYENPLCWGDFLIKDDEYQRQWDKLIARRPDSNHHELDGIVHFSIQQKSGNILHLQDKGFFIENEKGQIVGIAGITEILQDAAWEKILAGEKFTPNGSFLEIQSQFESILAHEEGSHLIRMQREAPGDHQHINNITDKYLSIRLTPREKECAVELLHGKTAKQSAKTLGISHRTVEIHLDNIKHKFNCQTKFELVSRLNELGPYAGLR